MASVKERYLKRRTEKIKSGKGVFSKTKATSKPKPKADWVVRSGLKDVHNVALVSPISTTPKPYTGAPRSTKFDTLIANRKPITLAPPKARTITVSAPIPPSPIKPVRPPYSVSGATPPVAPKAAAPSIITKQPSTSISIPKGVKIAAVTIGVAGGAGLTALGARGRKKAKWGQINLMRKQPKLIDRDATAPVPKRSTKGAGPKPGGGVAAKIAQDKADLQAQLAKDTTKKARSSQSGRKGGAGTPEARAETKVPKAAAVETEKARLIRENVEMRKAQAPKAASKPKTTEPKPGEQGKPKHRTAKHPAKGSAPAHTELIEIQEPEVGPKTRAKPGGQSRTVKQAQPPPVNKEAMVESLAKNKAKHTAAESAKDKRNARGKPSERPQVRQDPSHVSASDTRVQRTDADVDAEIKRLKREINTTLQEQGETAKYADNSDPQKPKVVLRKGRGPQPGGQGRVVTGELTVLPKDLAAQELKELNKMAERTTKGPQPGGQSAGRSKADIAVRVEAVRAQTVRARKRQRQTLGEKIGETARKRIEKDVIIRANPPQVIHKGQSTIIPQEHELARMPRKGEKFFVVEDGSQFSAENLSREQMKDISKAHAAKLAHEKITGETPYQGYKQEVQEVKKTAPYKPQTVHHEISQGIAENRVTSIDAVAAKHNAEVDQYVKTHKITRVSQDRTTGAVTEQIVGPKGGKHGAPKVTTPGKGAQPGNQGVGKGRGSLKGPVIKGIGGIGLGLAGAAATLAYAGEASASTPGSVRRKAHVFGATIKPQAIVAAALAAAAKSPGVIVPATARIAGKAFIPLGAAVGAYDIGRASIEGIKAGMAYATARKERKASEAKYGTVEAATRTRRARRAKR